MKSLPSSILLALIALPSFIFSQAAHAEETFSPTVKIFGYEHLLNGELREFKHGSGTIISPDGLVLASADVVMKDWYPDQTLGPLDAFAICISVDSNESPDCRFAASIERYDEGENLALLQIDPEPIWGDSPEIFPYLSYEDSADVEVGDSITFRGFGRYRDSAIKEFPGKIEAIEEGTRLTHLRTNIKSDAYYFGSKIFYPLETLLDAEGNFIGIYRPTENIDEEMVYGEMAEALHVTEIKKWIDSGVGFKPKNSVLSQQKLSELLNNLHQADGQNQISMKKYPGLNFKWSDNWDVQNLTQTEILLQRKGNNPVFFRVFIEPTIFSNKVDPIELSHLVEKFLGSFYLHPSYEKYYRESYLESNYGHLYWDHYETVPSQETIRFGDKEGVHFWKNDALGMVKHFIRFNYGYADILLSYNVPIEDGVEVQEEIANILESISFSGPEQEMNPEAKDILEEPDYPFTLQMPEGWKIVKSLKGEPDLGYAEKDSQFPKSIVIDYSSGSSESDFRSMLYDLFFHYDCQPSFHGRLSVRHFLSGLSICQIEYEDSGLKARMATVVINVDDPRGLEYGKEIRFRYKAEADVFEEGFEDFKKMLKTLRFKDYDPPEPEESAFSQVEFPFIPFLDAVELSDISGHLYEENIRHLLEKQVISGYPDQTFRPEETVNRAEALKMILESLKRKREESPSYDWASIMDEEPSSLAYSPENPIRFTDVPEDAWFSPYVTDAVEDHIISGYPDGTFKPESKVNLAEALKMALLVHQAQVWEGESNPWYEKYINAANALNLLPSDLQDPSKPLTRAELAHIIDELAF